jgi:hypothetical protein
MEWISVKERLPEVDGRVIVHAPSADPRHPLINFAWYDPSGFGWSLFPHCFIDSITHWMPLPEPPEVPDEVE